MAYSLPAELAALTRPASTGSSGTSRSSSSSSTSSTIAPELNTLIKQLSGVMQDRAGSQAQRQEEIGTNRAIRDDYSKEAAFTDAQGLMQQQLDASMEASLQALTQAVEGAGASGSSMRALLTQKAAQDAATAASALGAEQAVQYGGIANNTSAILELLTRGDDAALQALVQALGTKQQALTSKQSQNSSYSSRGNNYDPQAVINKLNGGSVTKRGVGAAPAQKTTTVNATYEPWAKTSLSTLKKPSNTMFSAGPTATNNEITQAYSNMLSSSPIGGLDDLSAKYSNAGLLTKGLAF